MRLLTGAKPTARNRLAGAIPHKPIKATPAQFIWKPSQLSMWGNQNYGDCVTAESAFAKACNQPEIFIPDHKVIKWARNHWSLNGAGLWEILTLMQTDGFDQGTDQYDEGPFVSVDWGDAPTLQNAISIGPVKIGVESNELMNIPNIGVSNGWIVTGLTGGNPQDHCTSLCGYGTFGWLASQLGVTLPADIEADTPGYAMFTWSTIGILDWESLQAITGEAWLRQPTTVIKPNP